MSPKYRLLDTSKILLSKNFTSFSDMQVESASNQHNKFLNEIQAGENDEDNEILLVKR